MPRRPNQDVEANPAVATRHGCCAPWLPISSFHAASPGRPLRGTATANKRALHSKVPCAIREKAAMMRPSL
eukprot:6667286-Pyramimonas_sp.AAC.1